MQTNKILLLFAHPAQDRSEVNLPIFQAASAIDGITCVDLYALYPKHDIDIRLEQERLRRHNIIIFLFPLYWYSTPALLKDWMDLVLEYDFAYGKNGDVLKGKYLLPVISTGGAEKIYRQDGYNHFTIRELLRPIEQTAYFCQMHFIPPLALFAARTAVDEGRLKCHIEQWRQLLHAFLKGTFNFNQAQAFEHLSDDLGQLIRG